MAIPFARSMRSLDQDRFVGPGWILAVGLALLTAWLGWFFLAEIRLYEVSESARVEVAEAAHPIAAEVSGRVIANHMALDKAVVVGDVLVELEAATEELELVEQESEIDATRAEMVQLQEGIDSRRAALRSSDESGRNRIVEAEAQFREAEAVELQARADRDRIERLVGDGIMSDEALEQAATRVRVAEADLSGARAAIQRLRSDWEKDKIDRESEIEELEREFSVLEGKVATRRSAAERLGLEVEKRSVTAAVSGRLDPVDLTVGSFVAEGQRLGSIVPESDSLIVAAYFDPAQALGRIRQGQAARLRLDGYPWTQFGTVSATVLRVGSEVRDGLIRVELSIEPDEDSGIELGHGLPGTLEVEVEEASPARLVVRSVGRLVSTPVTRTAEN